METINPLWIGAYVLIGLYLLYKILFSKSPYQKEYEKLYKEILTSSKYKVKGQYDKEH